QNGESDQEEEGGKSVLDSCFHIFLQIRIIKPDGLTAAVREFVTENLGPEFLPSFVLNIRDVFEQMSASTPMIFLLSSGGDTVTQLMRFAKEARGSTQHLDIISLGQGQGPKAEDLIHKALVLRGRWVFLENCHLAASFMPRLFKKTGANIDPQFRLFLSSKPNPQVPISILQRAIKIAVELPQGIRGKLLTTFGSSGSREVLDKMYKKENAGPYWRRLLFSLCFFNAVAQERKKYGALGWNIPYEFKSSDLERFIMSLKRLFLEQIPWQALRYLTGEVVYGGRVTDSWDRRCLNCILQMFYTPEILQEGHRFSADGIYHIISENMDQVQCVNYIESLPEYDLPDIFGMHPDAEKTFLESQSQLFMETVVSIQPRLSISGQLTRNVGDEKLPEGIDLANSALLTVLRQEIDRFNHLLEVILKSIRSLCFAVKGQSILTVSLEEVYNSCLNMKVPKLWKVRKTVFPLTFFLVNQLSDTSSLHLRQDESNFGDGVLVFGLYLDGAHWNAVGQSIEESKPGKRYCKMPSIHFLPVKVGVQEAYECPVYRTSQRAGILSATGLSTNFVTSVILPSQHPFSHWVTRGVALLCQLDD
uniref:Uncharacterized protein n=1 Tax=Callorhinchus milii TaxID=7868 RepID=A0A4W3K9D9_CALMI